MDRRKTVPLLFFFAKNALHYESMPVTSAKFIKGAVGTDDVLSDGTPQIAFIGRSNVGKSSLINSLTRQKDLAKTSSFPGRTREMNIFLINGSMYFVDLPGYGFAKMSREEQDRLEDRINWYFFKSPYKQKKIVLIIDANIGPTTDDLEMLRCLDEDKKDIIVVANKVDKIKNSEYKKKMDIVKEAIGDHLIIPYSSEKKIGITQLFDAISK
jgi:GTP-binding protein